MSTDPISMAHDALEKWLRGSVAIQRSMGGIKPNIAASNKLRGTELPDVVTESDLPRIRLEPIGGPCNINFASNLTNMDWSWRIILDTGDLRVNKYLGPVAFAIFASLAVAIEKDDVGDLLGVRWRTYDYAKNLTYSNITSGESDPVLNKGIAGLSAICDLTLHMVFPTSYLREFNNGN